MARTGSEQQNTRTDQAFDPKWPRGFIRTTPLAEQLGPRVDPISYRKAPRNTHLILRPPPRGLIRTAPLAEQLGSRLDPASLARVGRLSLKGCSFFWMCEPVLKALGVQHLIVSCSRQRRAKCYVCQQGFVPACMAFNFKHSHPNSISMRDYARVHVACVEKLPAHTRVQTLRSLRRFCAAEGCPSDVHSILGGLI